jgi:sterol desaturase/sphingolipid hydroxylase (fatty acid hydroxylase superfamily)
VWILLLAPLTLAAITAVEWRFPARRDPTQRALNVAAWLVWAVLNSLVVPVVSFGVSLAADRVGLPSLALGGWPPWLKAVAYIVAADFGEFAFHRVQHAVPFLWRMHSMHHSDPCMNATTTTRHFWGETVIKAVTIWPAAAIAFRPEPIVLAVYAGLSLYNYFIHANLNVNFGRWSWVLNSPAYHRVHHSAEAADFDTNFSNWFPIFDVLTGAYRRPRHCPATGLPHRPRTVGDLIFWPLRVDRLSAAARATTAAE